MPPVWGLYICTWTANLPKRVVFQKGDLALSVIFDGNKYELLYVQLQAICLSGAVQET